MGKMKFGGAFSSLTEKEIEERGLRRLEEQVQVGRNLPDIEREIALLEGGPILTKSTLSGSPLERIGEFSGEVGSVQATNIPQFEDPTSTATAQDSDPLQVQQQQALEYGRDTLGTGELGDLGAGGGAGANAAKTARSQSDRDFTRGMALQQMGLGLGQMRESIGSSSGKEYLGAYANYLGSFVSLTIPEELQSSGWGMIGPAMGIIGTALNMKGKREDYRNQRDYKRKLYSEIGKALTGMRNV